MTRTTTESKATKTIKDPDADDEEEEMSPSSAASSRQSFEFSPWHPSGDEWLWDPSQQTQMQERMTSADELFSRNGRILPLAPELEIQEEFIMLEELRQEKQLDDFDHDDVCSFKNLVRLGQQQSSSSDDESDPDDSRIKKKQQRRWRRTTLGELIDHDERRFQQLGDDDKQQLKKVTKSSSQRQQHHRRKSSSAFFSWLRGLTSDEKKNQQLGAPWNGHINEDHRSCRHRVPQEQQQQQQKQPHQTLCNGLKSKSPKRSTQKQQQAPLPTSNKVHSSSQQQQQQLKNVYSVPRSKSSSSSSKSSSFGWGSSSFSWGLSKSRSTGGYQLGSSSGHSSSSSRSSFRSQSSTNSQELRRRSYLPYRSSLLSFFGGIGGGHPSPWHHRH